MKLTFPADQVQILIDHALAAPEHRALYEQPETAVPGLHLVGDQGVYLMSNGIPILENPKHGQKGEYKNVVAYANECNPKLTPDWWENKRRSFGGDDGVEFIPLELLRWEKPGDKLARLEIEMSRDQMSFTAEWHRAKVEEPEAVTSKTD